MWVLLRDLDVTLQQQGKQEQDAAVVALLTSIPRGARLSAADRSSGRPKVPTRRWDFGNLWSGQSQQRPKKSGLACAV